MTWWGESPPIIVSTGEPRWGGVIQSRAHAVPLSYMERTEFLV